MVNETENHTTFRSITRTLLIVLLVVGVSAESYFLYTQHKKIKSLEQKVVTSEETLFSLNSKTDNTFSDIEQKMLVFSDMLYEEQQKTEELADDVRKFDRQMDRLTGSVDTLEKLTTTDPEILQKYSKIYFLNENYKPGDLTVIDEEFDYANGKEVTISSDVAPFLEDLLEDAKDDKIDIMVLSGFRSFSEQSSLKESYKITYGAGANQFSADQGYSEHQLGTTVDFTTSGNGEDLSLFENSGAYTWLQKNAYKYGFVMSYPKGNTFYSYEPWHWRFVGEKLAKYLYREKKNFYDLEQREIDTYIPTLFD